MNASRLEAFISQNGTTSGTAIAWQDLTTAPAGGNGTANVVAREKLASADTLNFEFSRAPEAGSRWQRTNYYISIRKEV